MAKSSIGWRKSPTSSTRAEPLTTNKARSMSNHIAGKVVVITVDVNEILFRPTRQVL
jgi:hypothetical protein